MKTRIITAVLAAMMLIMIILLGKEVYGLFIALLALITINELYSAFENTGLKSLRPISIFFILPLVFLTFAGENFIGDILNDEKFIYYIAAYIYLLFIIIFSTIVIKSDKFNLKDAVLTFFVGLIISFLYSFLIAITRIGETETFGVHYLVLLLLSAWGTDTFAYFGGSFFGKHKLAPHISPKKTIEGSISGIIGSIILVSIYGFFVINTPSLFIKLILMGLTVSILSQLGDLIASLVKRHCDIKDYGSILPGHGGVLDRFDSVLIIAPFVYFYIIFFMVG